MFSVVMSVYNGELFLHTAIESIVSQTFTKFEFIIVDDGSTDATLEILTSWSLKDSRIKIITRENKGLIASLNEACDSSCHEYIVRMDADDISLPTRLEEIYNVYQSEDNVELISSGAITIDMQNNIVCNSPLKIDEWKILNKLPGKNFIIHPSVSFKKKSFIDAGKYDQVDQGIEDVALWTRMKKNDVNFKFIKQHLIKYRINLASVRGIDKDRYDIILFKECLVNHDKVSAFKKLKEIKSKRKYLLNLMLLLPSSCLDLYTSYKNNKKIKKVYK